MKYVHPTIVTLWMILASLAMGLWVYYHEPDCNEECQAIMREE